MPEVNDYLVVVSTFPELDQAREAAERIVADRLAACAQIIPGIHSVFHWDGELDHAEEQLLLLKTTAGHYPALEQKIMALHPYELPEIIAVPITAGLYNYLNWIEKETEIE